MGASSLVVNSRSGMEERQPACQYARTRLAGPAEGFSTWFSDRNSAGVMRGCSNACGAGATAMRRDERSHGLLGRCAEELRPVNGQHRRGVMGWLLAFGVVLVVAFGVCAQPARAQPADLLPPSADEAMAAFNYVKARVLGTTGVGGQMPTPPKIGATGVCVMLWYENTVMGKRRMPPPGVAFGEGALARATDQAIANALARRPDANDAVQEEILNDIARRAQISVELAGPLVPLDVPTFAEADELFEPGNEGVMVRIGKRTEGSFPGTMMASGRTPAQALAGAISAAVADSTIAVPGTRDGEPGAIAVARGAVYYRFRTTHVAMLEPGGLPLFLRRCQRVVPLGDVTRQNAGQFADELAAQLASRVREVRGEVQLSGESQVHSMSERMLAAYALASRRPAPESRERLAAERLIDHAIAFGPAKLLPHDAAMAWLACERLGMQGEEMESLRARFASALTETWNEDVPQTARGVIALAIVRHARLTLKPGEACKDEMALRAVRSLYRETAPAMLVSHMPWLGWAEVELAGSGDVPASASLLEMRSLIWKHQTGSDASLVMDGGEEMDGGVVFTARGGVRPTWQTLRPGAFLATMLGDTRLTDEKELLREVLRMTRMVRFVRQLAVDVGNRWWQDDLADSRWAVRSAVWDRRLPPEAQSLAVLAVDAFTASLDARAAKK